MFDQRDRVKADGRDDNSTDSGLPRRGGGASQFRSVLSTDGGAPRFSTRPRERRLGMDLDRTESENTETEDKGL